MIFKNTNLQLNRPLIICLGIVAVLIFTAITLNIFYPFSYANTDEPNKIMNKSNKFPKIKISTTMGDITLELNAEVAPKSVENFLKYVEQDFYVGTIFHRVIDGFMIQGGGLDKNLEPKSNDGGLPIKNEADNGLPNTAGSVAMARTSDPHSATSQFFINVADNAFLNFQSQTMQGWGYAVFGKVVEGMDVVNKIKKVETGNRKSYQDVPQKTIEITEVELLK